MSKLVIFLCVCFAVISLLEASLLPQLDDGREELLLGDSARYYRFPYFWFRRPLFEDDDAVAGNEGSDILRNQRSSTVSYVNVGAGWGRR